MLPLLHLPLISILSSKPGPYRPLVMTDGLGMVQGSFTKVDLTGSRGALSFVQLLARIRASHGNRRSNHINCNII